ncbi:diacylglycerol kinase family protein [Streptomyces sp. H39-S7]|uniref:diacylglycerol kinase family protein n=1 Tax=Streptomyces sp. H39-S7 TaxID=3004357 RepID=UPI0022AFBCF0|nr:diacylglycerol kinase family protein [Streptomyces sp. H39-S7]MCZ4123956.1 diacylglycerol kinase family protein [Streptomyces sp. H39-S7]
MSAQRPSGQQLLVVIDPAARAVDGESVRIAKDVLCAGASSVKIALPDSAEEVARVLAHRGRRRPVVLGDDRSLLRAVRALHRERALGEAPLALVPIGPHSSLARALGVPGQVLPAARAVLDGTDRELDLLVDDSGGIVLGSLRISSDGLGPSAHWWSANREAHRDAERGDAPRGWWRPTGGWTARSLVRTLNMPAPSHTHGPGHGHGHAPRQRLRIEADGVVLVDLDHPVHEVSFRTVDPGLIEVRVHHPDSADPLCVRAATVTVSGRDFRYRADSAVAGPVRTRTWTVQPGAWRLTVPRVGGGGPGGAVTGVTR